VSLFDLTGKAAVVTGSSRGIGRAIVERMAEHGARVVVSSRHVEPCREVAAAINARLGDGRAIAIAANISANDQLQALVEETVRAFGQIDVLVCNAASNPTCFRSTRSAVRAPIDCFITRFKVALLIARTRPRLVGGHAGPNPCDLFYASLLVLGNNDFVAPRADLARWSSHKLTHIDD
jgi:NAD(P)-dependent dehydrogenase (short-subunit alcohol dehydrogenase family)